MRNRDKLNQTCDYDILCHMNERLRRIDTKGIPVCIMDALGSVGNPLCNMSGSTEICEKCISDWMNKPYKGK